ncbi:cysteine hydrolase [Kitasatospora sp. NBC_00085]|uniref:hypothetical protein n=1 Tax=unclassified Kitasatospora TaxID=2633591 RepID=UPI002F90EC18
MVQRELEQLAAAVPSEEPDGRAVDLPEYAGHAEKIAALSRAHDRGYTVYVIHDACAAFSRAQQEYVREHVIHHFGGRTAATAFAAALDATLSTR